MIVLENRLKEIFDQLPNITVGENSFKPTFSYGDDKDLNLYIRTTLKGKSIYPLIWLVYPSSEEHNYTSTKLKSDIKLILAVKNKDTSLLNEQRYNTTFDRILLPLLENVLKAFKGTKIAAINEDSEGYLYRIKKFPNYGDQEANAISHKTIEPWDAIRLEFNLTVNNCKIDNINF